MQPENQTDPGTALEPVHHDVEPIVLVDVDLFIDQSKKRVLMMKHIKQFALEHSTENDWVLQHSQHGPVPYLQATGCEKIARLFGVRLSSIVSEVTRKANGHFVWEFLGLATISASPGDSIEVFGSRDSQDPFFSRRHGEDIPPEDISERDVKMAAYSNFFVNAVSRLLGLRGFTVEMLEQAGLDPAKMRGVSYDGKRPAPAGKREEEAEDPDAKQKLFVLMHQIVGEDKDELAAFLEKITGFEGNDGYVKGVRTFRGMRQKRIEVTLGKLRKAVEAGTHTRKFNELGKPLDS